MKGNFLAFLFRALTYTQGHFMLSRVLLNRIKKEASRSSLGLDNRNYKLIIPDVAKSILRLLLRRSAK